MSHLDGLTGALLAVEKAIGGTGHEWLIRMNSSLSGGRFFANIIEPGGISIPKYTGYGDTPAQALAQSLVKFNLRKLK